MRFLVTILLTQLAYQIVDDCNGVVEIEQVLKYRESHRKLEEGWADRVMAFIREHDLPTECRLVPQWRNNGQPMTRTHGVFYWYVIPDEAKAVMFRMFSELKCDDVDMDSVEFKAKVRDERAMLEEPLLSYIRKDNPSIVRLRHFANIVLNTALSDQYADTLIRRAHST